MMHKTVLITGVSSGLGRKTAEYLGSKGYQVFGTVRTINAPADNMKLVEMDITQPASIQKGIDTIIQLVPSIDILINNAGMGIAGPVEDSSAEELALQMNTNFSGTVHVIQAVLPLMRKAGGGTIINISSIGGLMGLPFQSIYSASKFAIEGLSEGLRMELKPYHIKIIVIEPGDFKTSFTANRRIIASIEKSDYHKQFKSSLAVMEQDEISGKDPEFCARKIYKVLQKRNPRQRYIVSSFEQRLAVWLKYLLPGRLFRFILESHYAIK